MTPIKIMRQSAGRQGRYPKSLFFIVGPRFFDIRKIKIAHNFYEEVAHFVIKLPFFSCAKNKLINYVKIIILI